MSNSWQIKSIEYDKTNKECKGEASQYGQISILLDKYVLKKKERD